MLKPWFKPIQVKTRTGLRSFARRPWHSAVAPLVNGDVLGYCYDTDGLIWQCPCTPDTTVINLTLMGFLGLMSPSPFLVGADQNDCRNVEQLMFLANFLSNLPASAFRGLTNLKTLYAPQKPLLVVNRKLTERRNLEQNLLSTFTSNTFMDLPNLNFLSIANNGFSTLPDDVFRGLTSLTTLVMWGNQMRSIPGRTFAFTPNLAVLELQYNQIVSISRSTFISLARLTSVSLLWNEVNYIEPGAFSGNPILANLNLFHNALPQLDSQLFVATPLLSTLYAPAACLTPPLVTAWLHSDISSNPPLNALPRDIFDTTPLLSALTLNYGLDASCQPGGANWTRAVTGVNFCAKVDAIGVLTGSTVSWSCSGLHDRLRIPAAITTGITLGATTACGFVTVVDFSGYGIVAVLPTFLQSLTSLLSLNLANNHITQLDLSPLRFLTKLTSLDLQNNRFVKMPAGFTDTLRTLIPAAVLRLTGNAFPSVSCLLEGLITQAAQHTGDVYCEEYIVTSLTFHRLATSDSFQLTWTPASVPLLSASFSYKLGLQPLVAGNVTTGTTFSFPHASLPSAADGQAASLTVYPRFQVGSAAPVTAQWTLSVAPPSATIVSAPAQFSTSLSPSVTFRCSKFGCSFALTLDGNTLPVVRQAADTGLSFSGTAIDTSLMPLLATGVVGSFPDPPPPPFRQRLDGVDSMVREGPSNIELYTLSLGTHELLLWALDAQGAQQPCPLGLSWRLLPSSVPAPAPPVLVGSWAVLHHTDTTIHSYTGCAAASPACTLQPLQAPAVQLPDGSSYVAAAAVDVAGRSSSTTSAQLMVLPYPTVQLVSAGSAPMLLVQTKPSFSLLSRAGVTASWAATPSASLVPPGPSLLQWRWTGAQGELGNITTTATLYEPYCTAGISFHPRAPTCPAPQPGTYCQDEPVLAQVRSNCSTPLMYSADSGSTWLPLSTSQLILRPHVTSLVIKHASRTLAAASISRGPHRAFSVLVQFSCSPDSEATLPVASFCIRTVGWLPPDAVIQFQCDSQPWRSVTDPVLFTEPLSPGTHTANARVLAGSPPTSIAVASHTWRVLSTPTVPSLMWTTVPPIVSWAAMDTISWTATTAAVHHFQVRQSATASWQNTTVAFLSVPGSTDSYALRCVFVRGVAATSYVGDTLSYCWWNHQSWLAIGLAASNGGVGHGVFHIAQPLLMLWRPVAADSGIQALRFAVASSCSEDVTWATTSNWMVNVTRIPAGWSTVRVQAVGVGPVYGPLVCRRVFGTTPTQLPPVVLLQHPTAVSTESLTTFMFTNSTPSLASLYWFECQLGKVDPACPGRAVTQPWRRCVSPLPVGPLLPADYTFSVRTNDLSNQPTPAVTFAWMVQASSVSTITLQGLTDGPHALSLIPSDDIGKSGPAVSHSWIVDTTAPLLTSTTIDPPLRCTGPACFTAETHVTLAWSATDTPRSAACTDCSITVAVELCNPLCTSSTVNGTALQLQQEGDYHVSVYPLDPAHNTGPPITLHFIVDRTKPATRILLPVSGSITGYKNITLTIASDEWSTASVVLDSQLVWTSPAPTATGIHMAVVSFPAAAEGLHTITATSADGAGNADTTGGQITFVLDTQPPSTFGVMLSPSVNHGVTNAQSVRLALWGQDATTYVRNLRVTHQPPAGPAVTTTVANSTGWAGAALVPGVHFVHAQALDAAGNLDPVGLVFQWTVDMTPPTTTMQVVGGTLRNTTACALLLGGTDNTGLERWSLTRSGPAATLPATSVAPSVVVTAMQEGVHSITARATDWGDNLDTLGTTALITVDLTPPTTAAVLTSAAVSSQLTASLVLGGTDAVTAVAGWKLFHAGPAAVVPPQVTASQVVISDMGEGLHQLTARAFDTAGWIDPVGAAVTWRIDRTAPLVTAQLVASSPILNSTTAWLNLGGSGDIVVWRISYEAGAGCDITSQTTASQLAARSCAQGSHRVRIFGADAADNRNVTGAVVTWTVDTGAPSTTVALSVPPVTNASRVDITLGGADATTSIASWRLVHSTPLLTTVELTSASPAVHLDHLLDGQQCLHAYATDAAGNSDAAGASVCWVVDTVFPRTVATLDGDLVSNRTSIQLRLGGTDNTGSGIVHWLVSFGGHRERVTTPTFRLSALSDGPLALWAQAVDAAGNQDPAGVRLNMIIDTTPPSSTVQPVGTSPTADTTRLLTVGGHDATTCIAYWRVTYQGAGAMLPSRLDNSSAVATLSVSQAREGRHQVSVFAVDTVANADALGATSAWLVDITPPSTLLIMTTPNVSSLATAVFQLGGSDQVTTVVEWRLFHTGPTTRPVLTRVSSNQLVLTDLVDGPHTLVAAAVDAVNHTDPVGARVAWVIDRQPPMSNVTVLCSSPVAADSCQVRLTGHDATTRVELWHISHVGPPAAVPLIVTAVSNGAVFTMSDMVEGAHALYVLAVDSAGNVQASASVATWVVDLTPPVTAVGLLQPSPTAATAMQLQLGGRDDTTAITQWSIVHSGPHATVPTVAFATVLSVIDMAEGRHRITAHAHDAAGNMDVTGASVEWVVDLSAPVSTGLLQGPNPTPARNVSLRVTGSDNTTFVHHWAVQHSGPHASCPTLVTPAAGGGAAVFSCSDLAEGTHLVTTVATDAVGHVQAAASLITFTVDYSPPVTQLELLAASSIVSGTTVAIRLTGLDAVTHVTQWRITHEGAGSPAFPSTVWADAQGLALLTFTDLTDGGHAVGVTAHDAAGNLQVPPTRLTWTVDTTPPTTTLVSGQLQPFSVTNASSLTLQVTGHDRITAVVSWNLAHTGPGAVVPPWTQQSSFTVHSLSEGRHAITAYAVDAAGNQDVVGATFVWTVDVTPPHTLAALDAPATTPNSTMRVLLQAVDITSNVSSFAVEHQGPTATFSARAKGTAVVFSDARDGLHMATFFAIDSAGNQDRTGATVQWTVDTQPPTTTLALLSANPSAATTAQLQLGGSDATTTVQGWTIVHVTPSGAQHMSRTSTPQLQLHHLDQGTHTLIARAYDTVGNEHPTGTQVSWVVDTSVPTTTATLLTPAATRQPTAKVTLGGADAVTMVHCWRLTHTGPSASVPSSCVTGSSLLLSGCGEGRHELRVFSVDAAGNQDPAGSVVSWINDYSPPTTQASVRGAYLTNSSDVTIDVSGADALTAVQSWRLRHTDPAGRLTVWTSLAPAVHITQVMDGRHLVQVHAMDEVGNEDPVGANATVVVDSRPPTVSFIVYPQPLSNSSTVQVAVRASEPVSQLSVWIDNERPLLVLDGQLTQFRGILDGQHVLSARAVDLTGNAQTAPLVGAAFIVDTTPIADVTVQFDDLDAVGDVLVTAKSDVRLRFLQQDANSRPCWDCRIVVRGSSVRADDGAGPQGVMWLHVAPDGTHVLAIQAVDAAGNSRTVAPLTLVRDTTPPRTIVSTWNVPNHGFSNRTVVELLVTSTEPDATTYHIHTDFAADSALRGTLATVRLAGFADGQHCVTIQAEDRAHNLEPAPLVWCWTADTVPPVSAWLQPPTTIVGSSTIMGLLVPTDAGTATRVFAALGSEGVVSALCTETTCSVTVPTDGVWTIWLVATDAAGNVERLPQSRTVTVDTLPPVVSWLSPLVDGVAIRSAARSMSIVASDATRVVITATCSQTLAGMQQNVPVSVVGTELRVQGLADGPWVVRVTVTDQAAHTATLMHSWTVDQTPPRIVQLVPLPPALNTSEYSPIYTTQPICAAVQCVDARTGCSVQYSLKLRTRFTPAGCGAATGTSSDSSEILQPAAATGSICFVELVAGLYQLNLVATDGVGNTVRVGNAWQFALDGDIPAAPQLDVEGVDHFQTKETTLQAAVKLVDDPSPLQHRLRLFYRLDTGSAKLVPNVTLAGTQHTAALALPHLSDGLHVLSVWAVDAAGNTGVPQTYQWTVQSAAPDTVIERRPSATAEIGLMVWEFHVRGITSTAPNAAPITGLQVKVDTQDWKDVCGGSVGAAVCKVPVIVSTVGPHTFAARATNKLGVTDPEPDLVQWTVRQCTTAQMSNIDPVTGIITCDPCPTGGDCFGGRAAPSQVVARAGYWASSQSSTFYDCPLQGACMGGNGSVRALCAPGYTGVLCSLCAPGYYLQFGACSGCPSDAASAWFYMIGAGVVVLVTGAAAAAVRRYLPQTTMKIGLAMVQIIGNANTAFIAPWPAQFVTLMNGLKVFMLEILALTRTSCTAPITFYTTFVVNVFGMTSISLLIAMGVAAASRRSHQPWSLGQVLKPLFMFWLLCYPAVSLKLFQLFMCLEVEGTWLLFADMRLHCYDSTWWAYATVAIVYLLLFTAGLPLGIAAYLFRRRKQLDTPAVVAEAGFLYLQYGPQAYAWEALELVRKLVLTCALTLLDHASPLPLTLAVLVSALAQVLHAAFKPFSDRKYYYLQHGSLACTLIVFTIGLMFKVNQSTVGEAILSVALIVMCTIMLLAIVAVGVSDVFATIRQARRAKLAANAAPGTRKGHADSFRQTTVEPLALVNPLHAKQIELMTADRRSGVPGSPPRKLRVSALRSHAFAPATVLLIYSLMCHVME